VGEWIDAQARGKVEIMTTTRITTRQEKRRDVTKTTGTYTLDTTYDVVLCNCAGGAITLNLPAVATSEGFEYTIKKIDSSANAVTIDGNASELIDGATTQTINYQWTSATIVCDGSAWYIV
jgi:uncharacterized protein YqkB